MQIIGKKYLDSNFYNTITIYKDKIYIYSRDRVSTIETDHRFSEELKGKTDDEIIDMIIEQFLTYTRLCKVLNNEVVGTNGRKLKINTLISDNTKSKIKHKYESDRMNHLYESVDNNYSIISVNQMSSYDGNNYVLSTKDGSLISMEVDFLYEMIEKTFAGEYVYLTAMTEDYYYDSELISLNDETKVIKISRYLMKISSSEICNLVSNHNKNIADNKVRQLKLEVK